MPFHSLCDFNSCGRLAMILDGGPCAIGRESTIVDCTGSKPVIIRHGAISDEEIYKAVE